jgi:hypothetical protein
MKTVLKGELEIDHERGVIYFHITDPKAMLSRTVVTALRICNLPRPIPQIQDRALDITHMTGCDWPGEYPYNKKSA